MVFLLFVFLPSVVPSLRLGWELNFPARGPPWRFFFRGFCLFVVFLCKCFKKTSGVAVDMMQKRKSETYPPCAMFGGPVVRNGKRSEIGFGLTVCLFFNFTWLATHLCVSSTSSVQHLGCNFGHGCVSRGYRKQNSLDVEHVENPKKGFAKCGYPIGGMRA